MPGGSRAGEAVHLFWRIPDNKSDRDDNKSFALQAECLAGIATKIIGVSSAHHEEVGGLPVISPDIASFSNSRCMATTGERLLSMRVWIGIKETRNRGGAAPDLDVKVFFGRKKLGSKADKPSLMTIVRHLQ
jgi:hypothetical protein